MEVYLVSKLVKIHVECGTSQRKLCFTYESRTFSALQKVDILFQIDSTAEKTDQKFVGHTVPIKTMFNDIEVQSIGTDVLVLLLTYGVMEKEEFNYNIITVFFKLVTSSPTWYDIVYLINQIGINIYKTLPVWYCFIGYDTNSSFNGKWKCPSFDTWMKSYVEDSISKTFMKLGNMPGIVEAEHIFVIASLVKLVYFGSKNDKSRSLNDLRKDQFKPNPSTCPVLQRSV